MPSGPVYHNVAESPFCSGLDSIDRKWPSFMHKGPLTDLLSNSSYHPDKLEADFGEG